MRSQLRRFWSRRRNRIIVVGGVGFVVANVAAVFLTSQNWFCNSCHLMNSYHDSWKVSKHKDVHCVHCHIAPGMENLVHAKLNGLGQLIDDLLGRTSGKPSAAVSDFSCTRSGCHEPEKVRKQVKRKGRYFFDHGKHVNAEYLGIGTHCTTCHSHIKGSRHFEVNTNACITCHLVGSRAEVTRVARDKMPAATRAAQGHSGAPTTAPAERLPTRDCRKCHAPPEQPVQYRGLKVVHAEFIAYGASCESCHHHVTASPKKITDEECFSCHDFGKERMEDVVSLHRQHSGGEHKVECFSCHGLTSHGPEAQAMRVEQFDCRSCHRDQHVVQQRTYRRAGMATRPTTGSAPATTAPATASAPATGPAVGDVVTPMFLAHVDCTGCHTVVRPLRSKPDSGAMVAGAAPEACDRCHKPGLGKQLVPMWQKNTRQVYQSVLKMLEAGPPPDETPAGRLVAGARHRLDLVRLDGSWGVHNPRYTERLLKEARQMLLKAAKTAQDSTGRAQPGREGRP